jgi:hypothetical protein
MPDNYIRFLERQVSLYEAALEECIKQFDYSDDALWREEFKCILLDIAKKQYEEKSDEIPDTSHL